MKYDYVKICIPSSQRFFFLQHGKFFHTGIEGVRTEDVIHCTDQKPIDAM